MAKHQALRTRHQAPSPSHHIFLAWLTANKIPAPVLEHRVSTERKWRFDMAWPCLRIAMEIEGGVWRGGRHVTGRGYLADMEKYNAAALGGWMLLRVTPENLLSSATLNLLRNAIALRQARGQRTEVRGRQESGTQELRKGRNQ